jgi:hypothetical protein
LTRETLASNTATGDAAVLASDQSLFRYEGDCINPYANGATWSLDPETEGFTADFGSIPSLIDYFDAERDTQQVADPYFLP